MSKRSASDIFREMNARLSAKRQGKGREKAAKRRSEIVVQRLASDVSGKAQKYSKEGPRVFVPLPQSEEELTIDVIKEACEAYFSDEIGEKFECDVLATQQGPSCTTMEQLPDQRLIHVRFVPRQWPLTRREKSSTESTTVTRKRARTSPVSLNESSSHTKSEGMGEPGCKLKESNFVPMSLSLADMLKLGKLRSPDQSTVIKLYTFDLQTLSWGKIPTTVEFIEESDPLGTGGFRTAYRAEAKHPQFSGSKWVIKRYLEKALQDIHTLGQTVEQHTRKVVQMHLLARNFAFQLEQRVIADEVQCTFGKCLKYKNIYYGEIEGEGEERYVTVEEFINGRFRKYINNNGEVCLTGDSISEKAECLAHFSYEKSEEKLLLVDIQGCGYEMCDPEIASAELFSHDEHEKGKEILYCAGNMSAQAISKFFSSHKCNVFCEMAGLMKF